MILQALKTYLDRERVGYAVIQHPYAGSAQAVAAAAHIPGKEMAKTVVMKVDGEPALVVLPASSRWTWSGCWRRPARSSWSWRGRRSWPSSSRGASWAPCPLR